MSPVRPRHDWRFLLPRSTRGADVVVFGDADGTAADLLAASGLHGRIRRPGDGDLGPAGLVVRLENARGPLDDLGPYLGPDTVVVIERRRGAPARLSATLRRWGLGARVDYLVAPRHGDTRWYAPLHDGRALRWYLRSRFLADRSALSVLQTVARVLTRLGGTRALRALAPSTLTIAAPAGTDLSRVLALPDDVPATATMLLSSAQDARSRAVAAPFPGSATRPSVIVKIAPRPGDNDRTVAESRRLAALRPGLRAAGLDRTVPDVSSDDRLGALQRTVQSVASGPTAEQRISAARSAGERSRILDLVADWATGLAAVDPGPDRRVEGALLPTAAAHFDLAPCNVVLSPSGPVVVDWEPPDDPPEGLRAPIGADLAFFATYWAFQVAGCDGIDDEVAVVTALLDAVADAGTDAARDDAEPAVVAARTIRRHLTDVGLDPSSFPSVYAALWTQRAAARQARKAADAGAIASGAATRFLDLARRRLAEDDDRPDDQVSGRARSDGGSSSMLPTDTPHRRS